MQFVKITAAGFDLTIDENILSIAARRNKLAIDFLINAGVRVATQHIEAGVVHFRAGAPLQAHQLVAAARVVFQRRAKAAQLHRHFYHPLGPRGVFLIKNERFNGAKTICALEEKRIRRGAGILAIHKPAIAQRVAIRINRVDAHQHRADTVDDLQRRVDLAREIAHWNAAENVWPCIAVFHIDNHHGLIDAAFVVARQKADFIMAGAARIGAPAKNVRAERIEFRPRRQVLHAVFNLIVIRICRRHGKLDHIAFVHAPVRHLRDDWKIVIVPGRFENERRRQQAVAHHGHFIRRGEFAERPGRGRDPIAVGFCRQGIRAIEIAAAGRNQKIDGLVRHGVAETIFHEHLQWEIQRLAFGAALVVRAADGFHRLRRQRLRVRAAKHRRAAQTFGGNAHKAISRFVAKRDRR
ncbi:MAG: hypothetical protein ALAOOOJD_00988 [bacterium]|nr:hypothetical protein [bacterium]